MQSLCCFFLIIAYLQRALTLLIAPGNLFKQRHPPLHQTRLPMALEDDDERPIDDAIGAPVGPLPSVSSRINYAKVQVSPTVDLWVVGAGTLGTLAAEQWLQHTPSAKVVAETKSATRHEELRAVGAVPRLSSERSSLDEFCARNVLICIPPSASDNYEEELASAFRIWAGPSSGNLVFTSSTVVYGDSFGNTVDEKFRLDTRSARSLKMICAEEAILLRGGSVLRLAGLYSAQRGPHTFWMRGPSGEVAADPEGTLNMLHYADAAGAAIAALRSPLREQTYLACDDEPVSRRDMCQASLDSGLFPDLRLPVFTQSSGPKAKVCDSSVTRKRLSWRPKFPSFIGYMRGLGGLEYTPKQKKTSALWIPGQDDDDDLF